MNISNAIISFLAKVQITMKNPTFSLFEIHEIGQSLHNYYIDQRKIELIVPENIYRKKFGKQVVTQKLKTSKMDCHEDNSNRMMNCVNNFYTKKLGCTLPWIHENGTKCTGKEKFEEFKDLSSKLLKDSVEKELVKEGCFIPNCHQRSWIIDSTNTYDPEKEGNKSKSTSLMLRWYLSPTPNFF